MKVKEGRINDYRKKLGEIWPKLTAFLDRNKVKNFSIWNAEDLIFGYYENEDGAVLSAEEDVAKNVITAKIQDTFSLLSVSLRFEHLYSTSIPLPLQGKN